MKKVLVIVSTQPADEASVHWHGLSEWLGRLLDNVDVTMTALDQLVYVADGKRSAIYHPTEGYDIADFDLVLLRKVGDAIEYGIAVAHYLHLKGVPFTDSYGASWPAHLHGKSTSARRALSTRANSIWLPRSKTAACSSRLS